MQYIYLSSYENHHTTVDHSNYQHFLHNGYSILHIGSILNSIPSLFQAIQQNDKTVQL